MADTEHSGAGRSKATLAENAVHWSGASAPGFLQRPLHRLWLLDQARSLFEFFLPASINPDGGFFGLDLDGTPLPAARSNGELRLLFTTSRMVHCAAIGHQLGMPGCERIVDHGMAFLWDRHRDNLNGGFFNGVDDAGAPDPAKQAYGHAFVLLAAASAKVVGHPDADRLLADVTDILVNRFWDPAAGATSEEYTADWQSFSDYRGQNSNMHLTEALMAAFEATGDSTYIEMAQSIAGLIIDKHARAQNWRVPEHFDTDWNVDFDFTGDPQFRPSGTTPGHAMEWSRLLVQLWELGNRQHDWMRPAAEALFLNAWEHGWDKTTGGFYYTLQWDNVPDETDRYWWPCCEAIAAASVLAKVSDNPQFETAYRRVWGFVEHHFIDRTQGGWHAELDSLLAPVQRVFRGKPDIYHALQASLIPLLPANGSITAHLASVEAGKLLNGETGAQNLR